MPRLTHDRPGYTFACPACNETNIYERTGNGNATDHPDRPFRCERCSVCLLFVIERPVLGTPPDEQTTLPIEEPDRKRIDRLLSARGPEDFGLDPIGVRGGSS